MGDRMVNQVAVAPRSRGSWGGIAPGAGAVAGVQFLAGTLFWWAAPGESDAYGGGYGTFAIGLVFAVAFGCIVLPPLAFGAGWVHGTLFTTPVMLLSNAAGVRTRIPAPRWALPAVVLLAGVYAVPVALVMRISYAATWGWIAAAGVIPVGVAVYARMRQRRKGRVRLWALAATVIAVPTALVAGFLMPPYEPPVLERADYVGVWTGAGVRLELDGQGAVMAEKLPVDDGFEVVDRCSGHGTWKPREADRPNRAGVVLAVPECGEGSSLVWELAGTEEEPQLFVLIGDPDSWDVRVLRKRAR